LVMATADRVTAAIAAAINGSIALLNSGTFGVEVVVVEVVGLAVAAGDVVEVPDDASDITAKLPGIPSGPPLLTAYIVPVPES